MVSAASPTNRQLRKDARAQEILTAALGVFQARGFAAATIAEVAQAAGVANGTVYLYYPSKQDLFKAVVRDLMAPSIERIEEAALAAATPIEQLHVALEQWSTIMDRNGGCLTKLLVAEAGNFPDLVEFFRREVSSRVRRMLKCILSDGVASGAFRPCDIPAVIRILTASVVMSSLWRNALPEEPEFAVTPLALLPSLLDVVLNGITSESPRSS